MSSARHNQDGGPDRIAQRVVRLQCEVCAQPIRRVGHVQVSLELISIAPVGRRAPSKFTVERVWLVHTSRSSPTGDCSPQRHNRLLPDHVLWPPIYLDNLVRWPHRKIDYFGVERLEQKFRFYQDTPGWKPLRLLVSRLRCKCGTPTRGRR